MGTGTKGGDRDLEAVLREAPDARRAVGKWVRYLAGAEARRGGVFRTGLKTRTEPGWAVYGREVFGDLYGHGTKPLDPPPPAGTEWIQALHEQAADLPEWEGLQARSKGDAWAAAVAAGQVLRELGPAVKPPVEDTQAGAAQEGPEAQAHAEADHEAACAIRDNPTKVRVALRRAVKAAAQEIDDTRDAARAIGAGGACGTSGPGNGPAPEVLERVRGNAKLRQVAKHAGRLRARAVAKAAAWVKPGAEEVCDVKPGRDLGRLLPSETMHLADPALEVLLHRKLAEGTALNYELRGRERRTQGPIIVCLDESGSMEGEPDCWAKAVALTLLDVAVKQRRDFALVHFDATVTRVDQAPRGQAVAWAQVEKMVEHFSGGGTRVASALVRARDLIQAGGNLKGADVLLVSDGVDGDANGMHNAINALQVAGASVYGLAIGVDFPAELRARCAEYVMLDPAAIAAGKDGAVDRVIPV